MRYVVSRLEQEREEYAYRIYVTDSLKVIGENAAFNGGKHMNQRFYEVLNYKPDNRTSDDIIGSIRAKLGAPDG